MIRVLRETKQTPREIEERVARAGGRNRYGEPNFRVVWGWSRLTWIGGKWEDRDDAGNLVRAVVELRQVPKYFPQDRWHIERWFPPEQYGSPERWWAETIEREDGILIPALGPYPARGDWEHCFTLEQPGGGLPAGQAGFLALTATVCDYVIRAIEWAKAQPASAQLAALERRQEQRERDWHRHAEQVLWGDARAFSGQAFITVPDEARTSGSNLRRARGGQAPSGREGADAEPRRARPCFAENESLGGRGETLMRVGTPGFPAGFPQHLPPAGSRAALAGNVRPRLTSGASKLIATLAPANFRRMLTLEPHASGHPRRPRAEITRGQKNFPRRPESSRIRLILRRGEMITGEIPHPEPSEFGMTPAGNSSLLKYTHMAAAPMSASSLTLVIPRERSDRGISPSCLRPPNE